MASSRRLQNCVPIKIIICRSLLLSLRPVIHLVVVPGVASLCICISGRRGIVFTNLLVMFLNRTNSSRPAREGWSMEVCTEEGKKAHLHEMILREQRHSHVSLRQPDWMGFANRRSQSRGEPGPSISDGVITLSLPPVFGAAACLCLP